MSCTYMYTVHVQHACGQCLRRAWGGCHGKLILSHFIAGERGGEEEGEGGGGGEGERE